MSSPGATPGGGAATATAVQRPRPTPSPLTQPFWEATGQHRFLLQHCNVCATNIFYPRASCPSCGSTDLAWQDASGRGTVHTFTIPRRPTHRAFAGAPPIVLAIVELAEGPRVTTNLVDCEPADVSVGMAVELTWDETGDDGIALPLFRPAGAT
jgi:uncharacterized OB-fold protein